MVVTNQPVRCRTIDDTIRTLRIVSKEEGIECLRNMGIVNEETYIEYMRNLENVIKEEERKIKNLKNTVKSLENKKESLTDALFGLALGVPLVYVGYEFLKYGINVVIEYSGNYGLGAGLVGAIEGIIGGLFLLFGSPLIYTALKNIKSYVDAKNIERKIGKKDLRELRDEVSRMEKDLNKRKELYKLLSEYSDHFLRHY